MCEWNSPSAGLYKGTLNGDMIQWDDRYLPLYQVVFPAAGEMTFIPQTGAMEHLGEYAPGGWHDGSCDLAMKDGQLVGSTRTVYAYNPGYCYATIQSITVNGVKLPSTNDRESDLCYAAVPLAEGGNLPVEITFSGQGVDGPYTSTVKSSLHWPFLAMGCNRLEVTTSSCGPAVFCLRVDNDP